MKKIENFIALCKTLKPIFIRKSKINGFFLERDYSYKLHFCKEQYSILLMKNEIAEAEKALRDSGFNIIDISYFDDFKDFNDFRIRKRLGKLS